MTSVEIFSYVFFLVLLITDLRIGLIYNCTFKCEWIFIIIYKVYYEIYRSMWPDTLIDFISVRYTKLP